MSFVSDLRHLLVKNFPERVTETLIFIRRIIKKIYKFISGYNNWSDWIASILWITSALLTAFFLNSPYIQVLLSPLYYLLNSSYNFNLFKLPKLEPIRDWFGLNILVYGLLVSLLFLSFKFAARLKGIRLFIFFLVGFLSVKYWTICENGQCSIKFTPPSFTIPKELQSFIQLTLPQIIIIVILGIVLYLFIRWLSSSRGIAILPFDLDDETATVRQDNLSEKKSIADWLAAELHQIYHIHNLIEDGKLKVKSSSSLLAVCREDINFPLGGITGERLERTFTQLGTVSVSPQMSLPFGSLMLAIQQLWPQGSVQVITGSIIKKQNSDLQIVARYQQSNRHSEVHAYKVPQISQDSNKKFDLSELIKELAYRIALDLSSKPLSTNSWEAFKFSTEALHHICHYERTECLEELKQAKQSCIHAKDKDINYSKAGEILSWIGLLYLSRDRYIEASSVLEEATEISRNNPLSLWIYGHLYYYSGDYETALKHYNYAKELNPNSYEIYIKIGIVQAIHGKYIDARQNFLKSRLLECDNHAARSALAWLDFLCHLQELEDGRGRQADWRLEKAYRRLTSMDAREITNIDYSNFAIILLYKGGKNNIRKAYDNWQKALQLCPNKTTSDKVKHVFYELLVRSETIDDRSVIDRRLNQLNELLQKHKLQEGTLPNALIDDTLKDAKIIWKKCILIGNQEINRLLISKILTNSIIFYSRNREVEISNSEMIVSFKYDAIEVINPEISKACTVAEEHRQLEFSMRKFITFLEWIKTL